MNHMMHEMQGLRNQESLLMKFTHTINIFRLQKNRDMSRVENKTRVNTMAPKDLKHKENENNRHSSKMKTN